MEPGKRTCEQTREMVAAAEVRKVVAAVIEARREIREEGVWSRWGANGRVVEGARPPL
jgi:hypothetical protein